MRATDILIRDEQAADAGAIARLTELAFRDEPHSSHTEAFIVAALRRAGQLSLSLVATAGDTLLGHVAVSPVALSSGAAGWYGLGPISVHPDRQRQGIGSALMHAALRRLREQGAAGCVLLGEPAWYGRFGFERHAGLVLPGVPAGYFLALPFGGAAPRGEVRYHDAFEATA